MEIEGNLEENTHHRNSTKFLTGGAACGYKCKVKELNFQA